MNGHAIKYILIELKHHILSQLSCFRNMIAEPGKYSKSQGKPCKVLIKKCE